jgi:hypothetical protein
MEAYPTEYLIDEVACVLARLQTSLGLGLRHVSSADWKPGYFEIAYLEMYLERTPTEQEYRCFANQFRLAILEQLG